MQNAGTWNSDLAILFFFCLIAPIGMYFLGAFFERVSVKTDPGPASPPKKPKSQPAVVYVDRVVYRDRPVTIKNKKRNVTKPKKKAPKPPKRKAPEPLTAGDIINEAASALVQLGYKKREAVKVVKSIAVKKVYNSAESLIKDCFMCIS